MIIELDREVEVLLQRYTDYINKECESDLSKAEMAVSILKQWLKKEVGSS